MRPIHQWIVVTATTVLALAGCDDRSKEPKGKGKGVVNEQSVAGEGAANIKAEIWVDNWFALSVNGKPVAEDSVPFKTEKSFNAERVTFTADLPATVAFEFRDFRENDTGLEYIGTGRQQVGDGGAIVQFTDAQTGAVLKVSDSSWKCLVINHAPAEEACAKESDPQVGVGACAAEIRDAPADWTAPGFDDSQWTAATEHSASEVSPKHGYDKVEWKSEAKLIWGASLKLDNTVLCRAVVDAP